MTIAVAWLAFPVLLVALSLGVGLLVEGVARTRLPRALLVPVGLAGTMVLAQPMAMTDATAELGAPLVVAAGVAGFARSYPWRGERLDAWPIAAALGVFAVFAAPVVLSGEPTLGGYVELDDTASWLALTDRVAEGGATTAGLPPSSYEATLDFYLASGTSSSPGRPWLGPYPLGTFLPLGTGARLLGEDPAWLYQPYIAVLAAMLSLTLYSLASGAIRSRRLRSVAVFLASQPALLFAYALWGGAKEVAAAVLLALMSALVPSLLRDWGNSGALVPLAVAGAATLAVLSPGGGVWVLPVLLIALAAAVRAHGARAVARPAAIFAALLALMSLPALASLRLLGAPGGAALTPDDRLANLLQPLSLLQVFGVWPNGEFRLPPPDLVPTVTLVVIVAAAAALGLYAAARRRAWDVPSYALAAAAGGGVIVVFGSPWVDAKALVIASPAVVLAATLGAAALLTGGRRVEGALAAAAIGGGILWSNALAYHEVNLAPRERLVELERFGRELAGQGPTLMTDYEPYGVRYFLRDADPEGASELRRRQVTLRSGQTLAKAEAADIDELALDSVLAYRTLVLRRSPHASRPPGLYRLALRGRYYDAWQRRDEPGAAASEHLSLGGEQAMGAQPSCAEVRDLARRAGPQGRLTAASGLPVVRVSLGGRPGGWPESAEEPGAAVPGRGSVERIASVGRGGRYDLWLGGTYRAGVTISVDGRVVARSRHELSHGHPYLPLATVDLARGAHRITVGYEGPGLHPGSGGEPLAIGPVVLTPHTARERPLVEVDADRYSELCGTALDWVEVSPG